MTGAERAAAGAMHAEGANQTLPIAGKDGGFGDGVDFGQAATEGGFAFSVELGLNGVASFDRYGRNIGQPLRQGVEIEAGAADQQDRTILGRQVAP